MAIRLKKKEIRLDEGYATIRQLSPMDNIQLAKVLKDKDDDVFIQNAIIATSIVEIVEPDYNQTNYMILDPVKPHNYIKDPSNPDNYIVDPNDDTKQILDPVNPHNMILDSDNPDNYVLDRVKANVIKFNPVINNEEDILKRMQLPYSDWQIIAFHSLKMNEPNPTLLGE